MITFYDLEKTELYNLDADPGEKNDLSTLFPDKINELKEKLFKWQEETGAQFPTIQIDNQ